MSRICNEKEKYDPSGFRDAILQGFAEAGSDLDAVHKFLDAAGSKLDYRRYGEVIFDILLAGGILAPGGTLIVDVDSAKPSQTDTCVFSAPNNMEVLKNYAQLITKLIRRYKYLEKTLEEEFKKVLMFLKGFSAENRQKLARVLAVLIAGGQVPASVLQSALQDHLVKDGLALQCLLDVLQTWLDERDPSTLWAVLRKAGFDSRLMDMEKIRDDMRDVKVSVIVDESPDITGVPTINTLLCYYSQKNVKKHVVLVDVDRVNASNSYTVASAVSKALLTVGKTWKDVVAVATDSAEYMRKMVREICQAEGIQILHVKDIAHLIHPRTLEGFADADKDLELCAELTDDEIIHQVMVNSNDSDTENEEPAPTQPTSSELTRALMTLSLVYSGNMTLTEIEADIIAGKRTVQKKISDFFAPKC
ncbi:hypothetical protein HPB52_003260 [Rhipicephalus sanguineus]|uniref:5MP1/2-like HEAT domain-containing protein n=1 Tax=Rhipicephalus sanguineus TaxID=34632 RepID=A0A9D4SVL5_RHISA|nr:hypothetical protein HPB52_003260 [Rhipicephalus sanguineus]